MLPGDGAKRKHAAAVTETRPPAANFSVSQPENMTVDIVIWHSVFSRVPTSRYDATLNEPLYAQAKRRFPLRF